jgi:hypothetical protein
MDLNLAGLNSMTSGAAPKGAPTPSPTLSSLTPSVTAFLGGDGDSSGGGGNGSSHTGAIVGGVIRMTRSMIVFENPIVCFNFDPARRIPAGYDEPISNKALNCFNENAMRVPRSFERRQSPKKPPVAPPPHDRIVAPVASP